MKKTLTAISVLLAVAGVLALTGILDVLLLPLLENPIGSPSPGDTSNTIQLLGCICLFLSLGIGLFAWLVLPGIPGSRNFLTRADEQITGRFHELFGRYISFDEMPGTASHPSGFTWRDGLILVSFAIFSALFFLSHLQDDYPYIRLSSDGATIAAFAAAYDHPELFAGDPVLGDRNQFGAYQALIIPLIRLLTPFTDNYALAFLAWIFPVVFLFLSTFYLLGREFFQDRYWAVLFTILNAIPYTLKIDSTGIREPLPRVIFQAVLPLIIFLLIKLRDKPGLWFVVSIATGLLVYVHSVSTPAWAAGILLGYLAFLPRNWGTGHRLGYLVLQGVCVLLVMMPFILNFSSYRSGSSNVDLEIVNYIYHNHFPEGLLDVPGTVKNFLWTVHDNRLLYVSLASILILFFLGNSSRRTLGMVLLWGLGIMMISILLPYTERAVERYLRLPPFEIELLRGIRHFIFLMFFVTVWALSELTRRAKTYPIKYAAIAIGLLLLVPVYAGRNPEIVGIRPALDCLATGRIICSTPGNLDRVLQFLKEETPPGSRIFFANHAEDRDALVVRYIALRPLVYSHKDRGVISTNPAYAVKWYKNFSELSSHGEARDWYRNHPQDMIRFARGLGAEYLVLRLRDAVPLDDGSTRVVYHNKAYTVFSLEDPPSE